MSAADPLDAPRLQPVVRPALGSRGRMSDRVYLELLSAIREMRLRPGEALSETELSHALGVSRTPLRDATSRLADQGLLVVLPQVGTSVALIDVRAVHEAAFLRQALESAAFEEACADPRRDVGRARALVERQRHALAAGDGDAFLATDEDLHEEVFHLAGRGGVWPLVLRSKVQLDRVRRLVLPEAMATDELVEEHARLVDLLAAGDIVAGRDLVRQHASHVVGQVPTVRARHPDLFLPE